MRRSLPLIVMVVLAVMMLPPGAGAITNGEPDTAHPHTNVGALLYWDKAAGDIFGQCTGSLMAPKLFLTAAHCVDWGMADGPLWVTFESDLELDTDDGSIGLDDDQMIEVVEVTMHPNVRYTMATAYNDVAVLELEDPVVGVTPIELPSENLLGIEAANGGLRGHEFQSVGYGSTAQTAPFTSPFCVLTFDGLRRVSTAPFSALTRQHLHVLENSTATGGGGTGFGDSGGPKFYEEGSNLVVATTVSGDPNAQALGQFQRLDIPSVRGFLQGFLSP